MHRGNIQQGNITVHAGFRIYIAALANFFASIDRLAALECVTRENRTMVFIELGELVIIFKPHREREICISVEDLTLIAHKTIVELILRLAVVAEYNPGSQRVCRIIDGHPRHICQNLKDVRQHPLKAELRPETKLHLHTHNTTGTGDMVYLMAAMAGVDIVDTALSPLANGTSQPATESLVATLKGTVRDTGLDLDKMSEAAIHFRKVAEQLKASGALDPKVLNVDTNTLLYQVPGGMLSNLISQLKQAGKEDKYYDVLAEIPRVREDFGYPPLVTPSSQIVGTQAVLNIITGERYKMVPKESKAMLRGEYGKLPGTVNEDVRAKAGIKPEEVITCRPADLLEPELPKYREEFKDLARSEEDVLSLALFPQVAPAFINRRNLRTPKEHRTMAPIAHSAKHERAVAPFSRK